MTIYGNILFAMLAPAVLPASAAVPAAPAAVELSTAPADCMTCHKAVGAAKFTHGPVGVNMCAVCHIDEKPAADPAKRHVFSFSGAQPELCLACHEGLREKVRSSKFKHQAAKTCTACHDPHGSGQRFFLRGKNMSSLCSSCHENKMKGAVPHKPAKMSCALCHDPHGADNDKLLKTSQPELCLSCHQKLRSVLAGKYLHGPVQTGCTTCHDPHSAPKPLLLQADSKKELCLACHDDIAKKLKAAKRPHPAVETAGCTGCHVPHASDQPSLIKEPIAKLCSSCHKEKIAELKSPFLHGPVALGQCQACHDPHGSNDPKILKTFFPEGFYNPYQDGLYALCFNCHEKNIAREAKTTTLTDFRNGSENLHYAHVHSEKGRSCKACHAVHSSGQQKHIRAQVPFGTWMLPITFKKTATGGSCAVGCHKPRAYDRVKEVVNQ